ncbi:hypothetical protein JCM3765_000630 [Sporobolomyces pararoseus]
MAPAISLTDWYATIAYRDLSRRELCLKVIAETSGEDEDVEVRVVIRKTSKLVEGAREKGLAEFRLIGSPSLDKAEAAGIPKEFFVTFGSGIPSNWTTILKETASRPPSFLATLPPHANPVPSTSKLPSIAQGTPIRPPQPLPTSFFDLGTGFTLKVERGKPSSTRELAQAIRDRKGKSRAVEQTEMSTGMSFKSRDEEFLREERLKEKKDTEEKIAQLEKRVAEPEPDQVESADKGEDTEMHTANESAAQEPPPLPAQIIAPNESRESPAPPIPITTADHLLPHSISTSTTTSKCSLPLPPPVITSRTSSISDFLLDASHKITIASLVSSFFQRGPPKLTATEGPYVSFIRDIKEPVRLLLEALSVRIDLVSPSSFSKPRRKVKQPLKPFELVVKPSSEERNPSLPAPTEEPRQTSVDKQSEQARSPKAPVSPPAVPEPALDKVEEMKSAELEEEEPIAVEEVNETNQVGMDEEPASVTDEDQVVELATQAQSIPEAILQASQDRHETERSDAQEDGGLESEQAVAETPENEMVDKSIEEEVFQEDDEPKDEREKVALVESGGDVINGQGEIEDEPFAAAAQEQTEVRNMEHDQEEDDSGCQKVVQDTIKVDEREIKSEEPNEAEKVRLEEGSREAGGTDAAKLDQVFTAGQEADESEQEEMSDDEEFEDSKVFAKLSPRITGEYDEMVPIKLDSSSPPPRLSSPPPPGSSPRPVAAEILAHPVNVLPSPPNSPPRSSPDPALPRTPSFSDFYEDYDSENSIDTEAQEVADFVERETMGHSSDGFEEVISPSKKRPSKTIEPPETVSEEPQQEDVETPSISNGGGLNESNGEASASPAADRPLPSNANDRSHPSAALSRSTSPDLSSKSVEQPSPVRVSPPPRLPSPFLHPTPEEHQLEAQPQVDAESAAPPETRSPAKPSPLEPSPSLGHETSVVSRFEGGLEGKAQYLGIPSNDGLEDKVPPPTAVSLEYSTLAEASVSEHEAQQVNEESTLPLEENSTLDQSPSAFDEPVAAETSEEQRQDATESVVEPQDIQSKKEEEKIQAHAVVREPKIKVISQTEEETSVEKEEFEQPREIKAASPLQNGSNNSDPVVDRTAEEEKEAEEPEALEIAVVEREQVEEVVSINKENIVSTGQEVEDLQEEPVTAVEEDLPGLEVQARSNRIEEVQEDGETASAVEELPQEAKENTFLGSGDETQQVLGEEGQEQTEEQLAKEVEINLPVAKDRSPSPASPPLAVSNESHLENTLKPVSQESDTSVTSQATEAAMKALRNESISSEPAAPEESYPDYDHHDFGGGLDEEDGEQLPDYDPDSFETSIDTFYGQDRERTSTNATPLEESPQVETLPSLRLVETAREKSSESPRRSHALPADKEDDAQSTFSQRQIHADPVSPRNRPLSRSPSVLQGDPSIISTLQAERSPSLRLPEEEDRPISKGPKHKSLEVHNSSTREKTPLVQTDFGNSSSSEVRSPPPRRRPIGGWKPKQKTQSVEPKFGEPESDVAAKVVQVETVEVAEEEMIESRRPRAKGKGKGKAPPSPEIIDAVDDAEDEIGLSPQSKRRLARKRPASPATEEQQSSKPRKLPKTHKIEGVSHPITSGDPKTKARQREVSPDSGHGTATPEVEIDSAPSTSRRPHLSKPTPSRQTAPPPVQTSSLDSNARASPQKTSKRPVQTRKSNGGSKDLDRGNEKVARSATKRRREVIEDDEVSEEEVEQVTEKKKLGQPQAEKPKKVVAQRKAEPREEEEAEEEEDEEEEEEETKQTVRQPTTATKRQKARTSSPVDGDYNQGSASEQEDSSPAPAASKAKAKTKAPPKKRRKRKSIVMPRTKKRPSSTPQASSSKSKAVVEEDEEKPSRAKAVRKPRKRESTAGSAKKGSSPSKKRKKFAESESEDSEEWKGD